MFLDTNYVVRYITDAPPEMATLEMCRNSKRTSLTDAFLWAQVLESGAGSSVYTFERRFPATGITLLGTEEPT